MSTGRSFCRGRGLPDRAPPANPPQRPWWPLSCSQSRAAVGIGRSTGGLANGDCPTDPSTNRWTRCTASRRRWRQSDQRGGQFVGLAPPAISPPLRLPQSPNRMCAGPAAMADPGPVLAQRLHKPSLRIRMYGGSAPHSHRREWARVVTGEAERPSGAGRASMGIRKNMHKIYSERRSR